ncbi:MAG: dihydroorotate dehydrogenase [Magnetococcus sp. DMHC-6]
MTLKSSLSINLAGIPLNTPVVLLSGCVGFGEDLAQLDGFDFAAIGAIFLKGTTLHPRQGNKTPRLIETSSGLLNAIGLQNPGAKRVVELYLPRLAALPTRFIANIAGSTIEEYGEVAKIFDQSPIDGMEINISCPNVKEGGAAFGSDPSIAFQVVQAVRKATSKPIFTKLSPNVTDIRRIAQAAIEAGSDGLSAINTLMGMAVDVQTRRPLLGNKTGGLSGAAIKPVAVLKVWEVCQVAAPHGIPVVGQGGIRSAQDALEFFIVGASAVGVGTGLFGNPLLGDYIAQGLATYLESKGLDSIRQVVGTLETGA